MEIIDNIGSKTDPCGIPIPYHFVFRSPEANTIQPIPRRDAIKEAMLVNTRNSVRSQSVIEITLVIVRTA